VASYKVLIKPSAAKELENIPLRDRRRVVAKIESLAHNPRPPSCERLTGHEQYRIRQGNYRILYTIDDPVLIVVVIRIGHRREVYR
jgi:mRNA interferase RelE/StbE